MTASPTRRLLVAVLLIVTMALTTTPAAWAHAVRTASDPADGATLTAGPARVTATFSEQLQSEFAAMTVVGPDGKVTYTNEGCEFEVSLVLFHSLYPGDL